MSEQDRNFFVYVIESPSAPDLYHRRSEGDVLAQTLRLSGITCVSRCAISKAAFQAAIMIGLKEEMAQLSQWVPIVHISCHGNSNGIQLSSGECIAWHELANLLVPINNAFSNNLVVAMSCCNGYSGVQMAMIDDDTPLPYLALIGTSESPTWSDTVVAFSAFYHRIRKSVHISEAVQAMSSASGCEFWVEWAENSKKSYLEYLKQPDLAGAQQALEANAQTQPPGHLEKMITLEGASANGGKRHEPQEASTVPK